MIGIDYSWHGQDDREREQELPSLQVKDEHSGMVWSSVIPAKGADQFAVDFLLGVLDECGYKRVILKSDSEYSINKGLEKQGETSSTHGDRLGRRKDWRQAINWSNRGFGEMDKKAMQSDKERTAGEAGNGDS